MKYSYVARQPILDSSKNTVAYELLFRDGPKNTFPSVDPELATNKLLFDQFLDTQYHAIGNKLGFVNFPYNSLIELVPTLFSKEKIVVEVLEDCPPSDDLFEAIKALADKGYRIALDDFIPTPEWRRFFPYIHIIKFDIRTVPLVKASQFIERLKGTHIEFLAEKVESYEEYQHALEAGFTYFQGYFFSKPEVIQQKSIQPSLLTVVQLCKAIAQPEIDFEEVERLISVDLSLSYKLLVYVNSCSTISSQIKSFHQALAYLGEEKLRKFVSLVAVASTQNDKPESLYNLSLHRARFCELISTKTEHIKSRSQAFLTGIFSLLGSLLDQPLEQVVESMPIDTDIKSALLERTGYLGEILALTIAYEKADWDSVSEFRHKLGISPEQLSECYDQSLLWTEELFDTQGA